LSAIGSLVVRLRDAVAMPGDESHKCLVDRVEPPISLGDGRHSNAARRYNRKR
jgi:hypothetical protein